MVPKECGDVPMERACLLTLYAEIFANMTKMNAPAKAAKKSAQEQPPMARKDGNIGEKQLQKRRQNSRSQTHT